MADGEDRGRAGAIMHLWQTSNPSGIEPTNNSYGRRYAVMFLRADSDVRSRCPLVAPRQLMQISWFPFHSVWDKRRHIAGVSCFGIIISRVDECTVMHLDCLDTLLGYVTEEIPHVCCRIRERAALPHGRSGRSIHS